MLPASLSPGHEKHNYTNRIRALGAGWCRRTCTPHSGSRRRGVGASCHRKQHRSPTDRLSSQDDLQPPNAPTLRVRPQDSPISPPGPPQQLEPRTGALTESMISPFDVLRGFGGHDRSLVESGSAAPRESPRPGCRNTSVLLVAMSTRWVAAVNPTRSEMRNSGKSQLSVRTTDAPLAFFLIDSTPFRQASFDL